MCVLLSEPAVHGALRAFIADRLILPVRILGVTLDEEVELVWQKKWNWVTLLWALVCASVSRDSPVWLIRNDRYDTFLS